MCSSYPYGKLLAGLSLQNTCAPNQLKYNKKHYTEDLDLQWHEMGWRPIFTDLPVYPKPDRFAEKYYHLSPYSYAANNPINYIDINGDSIWYSQSENVITMHVRGKVINSSSSNINVQRAAHDIAFGINSVFGGTFKMRGQEFTVKTDIQLEGVTSMKDVAASDHLFNIVDSDGKSARGAINQIGGKVINLASVDYSSDNWFSNVFGVNNVRTAIHEFGHAVGLTHESASGWSNIMRQKYGTFLTSGQMEMMIRAAPFINKGTNSYMGYPYPYLY